jgi:hypothetical protein
MPVEQQHTSLSRKELWQRRKTIGVLTATAITGAIGLGKSVETYYNVPAIESRNQQVIKEINARADAPKQTEVYLAKNRLDTGICDDRPCTEDEKGKAALTVYHAQQVNNEIARNTQDTDSLKTSSIGLGAISLTVLSIAAVGAFLEKKTRRASI